MDSSIRDHANFNNVGSEDMDMDTDRGNALLMMKTWTSNNSKHVSSTQVGAGFGSEMMNHMSPSLKESQSPIKIHLKLKDLPKDDKHKTDRHKDSKSRDDRKKDENHKERSKDEKQKNEKPRDEKHKDDKHKNDKHKDDKHRDEKHKDNKHKDVKHKDSKTRDDKHKDGKVRDDKHKDDKHRDDKHKDSKHKDDKHISDKHRSDRPKGDKHKDEKSKSGSSSSSKPKEGSHSSSSKPKENSHGTSHESSKHRESSGLTPKSTDKDDGKLKEKVNNNSNSIIRPKEVSTSSKMNDSITKDKTKDVRDKSKENKSSSSSSHKHSGSDVSSSPEKKSSNPDRKSGSQSHDKDKKVGHADKDGKKHSGDSHKHSDKKHSKEEIKKMEKPKMTMTIKKEPNDHSLSKDKESKERSAHSLPKKADYEKGESVKAKDELASDDDDDSPLSVRKGLKLSEHHGKVETFVKKEIKREKQPIKRTVDEDSEDEPVSVRIAKAKKAKMEAKQRKRKLEESDEESFSVKKKKPKLKQVNHKVENATSPKKKGKKEDEQEVWKWWEEEKYEDGVKWRSLEHKGPILAPEYEPLPKSVKFYYDGKTFELSPGAEEVATFYARMLDHDYTTKEAFNKNFFKDWRKTMTEKERVHITDLKKCKFNEMNDYFKAKSEERKNMTKEEKAVLKKKNEEMTAEYGFCIIDGHKEKIGNYKIEPPGLFRGRGEHPKMGMLKRRTMPEDVIINCSKNSNVPKAPSGRKWKEVRHDNSVTWLACWVENVQGQTKYVMLNASSKLKGEKDWQKYEVARKLKSCVGKIRENYMEDWKSKEMRVRQRSVALYFIDKLALRAGNEKEEGETADTVGCCSLRVEHIKLHEKKGDKQYIVDFDFLGKDSIRYQNSVQVEKRVFKNLQLFMDNKRPEDDLFDRLNTSTLNKHLNELMDGLTAKVFRTFNASKTLQEQLDLLTKAEDPIAAKILSYNRANRAVAILCNHQRSIPKTFSKSMEALHQKIEDKKVAVKDCSHDVKQAKKQRDQKLLERKQKQLERLKEQLHKLELQATDKEENKDIALGTSKLNYLDPRISVAWCKKWNVPLEKIYNRTQRDKFRWAIEMATAEFKF